MRVRECDNCDARIAEHDLGRPGSMWVELSDAHEWLADACSPECGRSLLAEHRELALVQS